MQMLESKLLDEGPSEVARDLREPHEHVVG
jgi:hypothetical protein